jgi:hypothetical protein
VHLHAFGGRRSCVGPALGWGGYADIPIGRSVVDNRWPLAPGDTFPIPCSGGLLLRHGKVGAVTATLMPNEIPGKCSPGPPSGRPSNSMPATERVE